jgi:protein-S-isoprenylcysteine O-methyltransferase Ste14
MNARAFVPGVMLAALLLLLVVPVLRTRWRHRSNAMAVLSSRSPLRRLADGWMMTAEVAWFVWTFAYWLVEPGRLAVIGVPWWAAVAGWAAVLTGVSLAALAQAQMGASFRVGIDSNPTNLVTGGLFAYSRNPIFAALLLAFTGLAVLTLSAWTVLGLAVTLLVFQLQSRLEEEHLMQTHGDVYRRYAAKTGRFLPGFGKLTVR